MLPSGFLWCKNCERMTYILKIASAISDENRNIGRQEMMLDVLKQHFEMSFVLNRDVVMMRFLRTDFKGS